MSAQHTPGPLRSRGPSAPKRDAPEGGDFAIMDAQGEIIGEAFRRSSPAHLHPAAENARLWAAAPDLLEALETARNGLRWYQEQYPQEANGCDDEAMQQIDAAIAKAGGAA